MAGEFWWEESEKGAEILGEEAMRGIQLWEITTPPRMNQIGEIKGRLVIVLVIRK